MRITKLLSLDSEPAKPILDRAKPIALAFLERIKLPETFVVGDQTIENALGEVRPLEVGDVLVDENGASTRSKLRWKRSLRSRAIST